MDSKPQDEVYPLVTVVMPIRDEERFIESTIQQLLDQDYPADKIEIIVVDGLSEDNTRTIVRSLAEVHPQIILLDNPKRRSSSGRNIGFKAGKGDYFVVVDGHCYLPDRSLINSIVDSFRKSGADCLGRPQTLDPPGLTVFQKAVALARAVRIGHGGSSLIYSSFEGYVSPVSIGAMYAKGVFGKIGYVDENFDVCEDVEFNYRVEKAGLLTFMSPSLKIKYYPRDSVVGLWKQMIRYGRGRFNLFRKHSDTLTFNTLIPPLFSIFFFGMIPSAIIASFFLSLSWLKIPISLLILYLVIVFGESVRMCWRVGWAYLKFLPVIFLTVHLGLGCGFIQGFCSRLCRPFGK